MMREDERDRVERQATEAWKRLKREKSWGDWLKVGEGLQIGREWAMNQAMTNQPIGKAYNMAFGEWMVKRKLDDMDKGDRSRLFSVMDNLGNIEQWRQTLTLTEKLKLNHPNAVWRKWKAANEPEAPKAPKPTLKDTNIGLQEELASAKAELTSAKAHISELEAARDSSNLTVDQHFNALIGFLQDESRADLNKAFNKFRERLKSAWLARHPETLAPAKSKKTKRKITDDAWREAVGEIGKIFDPKS